jgi:signal transduction histidine kinase
MSGSSEPSLETPLIERIRRALAHDLRTPLGTIANYAAILEYHGPDRPEDVRVFADRIRTGATRTVEMLQRMTDALELSRLPPSRTGLDPTGTLRAVLSDFAVRVRFPARGAEPNERIPFDAELVSFAWRAFLSVNLEAARTGALDIDLEIEHSPAAIALDMFVGDRSDAALERVGSSRFAQDPSDGAPIDSCFALGLAEDLMEMRGGELTFWGRPGASSGVRIRFPRSR